MTWNTFRAAFAIFVPFMILLFLFFASLHCDESTQQFSCINYQFDRCAPYFFLLLWEKKTFRNPSHSFVLYLRFSRTLEMDLEICLIEGLRGLPSLFLLCTYEIVITLRFV